MTTPPLVTLPAALCTASMVMSLQRVVANSVSPFTLAEQSFLWQGARWQLDFNPPPITDPDLVAEIRAFILKLQGSFGNFLAGDPSYFGPRGAATGTPVVNGAGQTGTSLITSGWSNSVTGIMKAGDYFQLGTGAGARLHCLTEDINSGGGGAATLKFEPPIRTAPANGSAVVVTNPKGLFKMTSNSLPWSATPGGRNGQGVFRYNFQAQAVVNA